MLLHVYAVKLKRNHIITFPSPDAEVYNTSFFLEELQDVLRRVHDT